MKTFMILDNERGIMPTSKEMILARVEAKRNLKNAVVNNSYEKIHSKFQIISQ